jgi:hypothetical protein
MFGEYFSPDNQVMKNVKAEVAREIGFSTDNREQRKEQIAHELGLSQKINAVGWSNMTSGECGAIGGRMGGKLGGQMVKRLIEIAESQLGY